MEVNSFVNKYLQDFQKAQNSIEVTVNGEKISFETGIEKAVEVVRGVQERNNKMYFVGNGGSAGITQHQAVDFWKNGKVRAQSFNDPSLLTCISNDLGYENVFSAPLEMFLDEGDLAMCISSSGGSENILRAARAGKKHNASVITFSGFSPENPLRSLGDINFYVPSYSYGFVELIHEFISHCILDSKMYVFDEIDIFHRNTPMEK